MKTRNYWTDLYGSPGAAGSDFVAGVKAGIEAYAYWKDGIQYVGTTGETLEDALKEVDEAFELWKLDEQKVRYEMAKLCKRQKKICPECKGEGQIWVQTTHPHWNFLQKVIECPVCKGTGKRK